MIKVNKINDRELKLTLPQNMSVGQKDIDIEELYHALTDQLVPLRPTVERAATGCVIQNN